MNEKRTLAHERLEALLKLKLACMGVANDLRRWADEVDGTGTEKKLVQAAERLEAVGQ